jgi:hypothetical protein
LVLWYIMRMKASVAGLLMIPVLLVSCGKQTPPGVPEPTNTAASGNPLTAPADYVGAISQAQKHSVKVVNLAQIKQAIRFFEAQEGRFPRDLDELVARQYLPALPALPAGVKYHYNPTTGEIKVVRAQ